MSEIKKPLIRGTDDSGDPTYTITAAHTLADIVRYLLTETDADELRYLIEQESK